MSIVSSMAVSVYGFIQPKLRKIEPAGLAYESHIVRDKIALGVSTLPVYKLLLEQDLDDDNDDVILNDDFMDKEDAKYMKYMSRLNPNDAKDQDHYRVLGLAKLRHSASFHQIKFAYRQKVLKYHPDKGNQVSKETRNEALFACIQKAYEQLGLSIEKRRAYDSIDPKFDETIPDASEINSENFFKILKPIFERNSRFSNNQPVPGLGDKDSDRHSVENFYDFWSNWSSWREFSYLDSEDKTKGEDRWERREIEKLNKIEREKRRKKDLKRISTLVELAYCKDPRIAAFKEEDRRKKNHAKEMRKMEREKKEQARRDLEMAEERALEAERQVQLLETKQANFEKQKKKKVLAAQRRKLRDLSVNAQYWSEEENKKHMIMEQIERVCINADFEEISALCKQLSEVEIFDDAFKHLKYCCSVEHRQLTKATKAETNTTTTTTTTTSTTKLLTSSWTPLELQMLVKAVNLFPPGTAERWKQVAEYVTHHGKNLTRSEKEVIKQVKTLNAIDSTSTPAEQLKVNNVAGLMPCPPVPPHPLSINDSISINNKSDSDSIKENNRPIVVVVASTNGNSNSNATSIINGVENANNVPSEEWSIAQQKQLENALKATSTSDPLRWEKIAQSVDGKNKKECVKRYKYLAERVKLSKNRNA